MREHPITAAERTNEEASRAMNEHRENEAPDRIPPSDSAAEEDPLDRMAAALCQAVDQVESLRTTAGVEEQSWLNMAVTDGECAVVSRYVSDGSESAHSLYWACGCLMVERGEGRVVEGGEGTPAVIVASEPLGPDTAWKPVPPNHLVLVSSDREVEVRGM